MMGRKRLARWADRMEARAERLQDWLVWRLEGMHDLSLPFARLSEWLDPSEETS